MRKRFFLPLTVAGIAVSFGCRGNADPISGKWKDKLGDTIVFAPDHTFSQSSGLATGKWSFSDGKLTVTVEKIKGMTPEVFLRRRYPVESRKMTKADFDKFKKETIDFVLAPSEDGKTLAPADLKTGLDRTMTRVES